MEEKDFRGFYPLNPTENLSGDPTYEIYSAYLDEIRDNKQVRNIALIGERGTGKSSILRTYDKESAQSAKEKGDRAYEGMLFVSLIDFEERKGPGKQDDEKTAKSAEQMQKWLECGVLRQILVRCTGQDLKNSRLRSVVPTEPRQLKKRWIFAWLMFTGLIFGLMFEERFGVVLRLWNAPDCIRVTLHALGYILLFLSAFAIGVYSWRTRTYPIRLGKVTVKHGNAEAELLTLEQKHCLDEYKFEIIHILDKLAPRIGHTVIFEDMERFGSEMCVEIMMKLRDLNNLVNTYRRGRDPKAEPIRFVYALDDKVFTYENRIKFFDVVLPMVPKLNHESFVARFCMELKNATYGQLGRKAQKLIEGLKGCTFDYRLMHSAINEYKLFRLMFLEHQLARNPAYVVSDDDDACILAIALYKTLFPAEAKNLFLSEAEESAGEENMNEQDPQHGLQRYLMERLDKKVLRWILYPYGEIAADWERRLTNGTWAERISAARMMCEGNADDFRTDSRFFRIFEEAKDPELARILSKVLFRDLDEVLERIRTDGGGDQTNFICYLAALNRYRDTIPEQLSTADREMLENWCARHLNQELAVPDTTEWGEDWNARWQSGLGLTVAACLSKKRDIVPGDRQLGEKNLTEWFAVFDAQSVQHDTYTETVSEESTDQDVPGSFGQKPCELAGQNGSGLHDRMQKLLKCFGMNKNCGN